MRLYHALVETSISRHFIISIWIWCVGALSYFYRTNMEIWNTTVLSNRSKKCIHFPKYVCITIIKIIKHYIYIYLLNIFIMNIMNYFFKKREKSLYRLYKVYTGYGNAILLVNNLTLIFWNYINTAKFFFSDVPAIVS